MIVRDEAETIDRCLESAAPWVSEIVVVDTGSSDDTRAKAKARGARVRELPWKDDFAEARNLSLSDAKGDWILVLDGDEWIESAPEAAEWAERAASEIAFFVSIFDHLEGGALRTYPQCRLFRNDPEHRFRGAFPEQIAPAIATRSGVRWIEPPHSGFVVGHDGFLGSRRSGARAARQVEMLRRAIVEHRQEPAARYLLARERVPMRGLRAVPGRHLAEALVHLEWLHDHPGALPKRTEADACRLLAAALVASDRAEEARAALEPWRESVPVLEILSAEAHALSRPQDRQAGAESLERMRAAFDQDSGRGLPFREPRLTAADARARAAELAVRIGRWRDALRLASEAAELPGGGAAPFVALAAARLASEDRAGAREALETALERDPEDPWAWAALGGSRLSDGEAAEAVDAFRRAAAIAPGWERAEEGLAASLLVAERSSEIPAVFTGSAEGAGPAATAALALAAVAGGTVPASPAREAAVEGALTRILRLVESAGKRGLLQQLAAGVRANGGAAAGA